MIISLLMHSLTYIFLVYHEAFYLLLLLVLFDCSIALYIFRNGSSPLLSKGQFSGLKIDYKKMLISLLGGLVVYYSSASVAIAWKKDQLSSLLFESLIIFLLVSFSLVFFKTKIEESE